jgi:hypothetical protein
MGPASNWRIARPDFRTHLFLSHGLLACRPRRLVGLDESGRPTFLDSRPLLRVTADARGQQLWHISSYALQPRPHRAGQISQTVSMTNVLSWTTSRGF